MKLFIYFSILYMCTFLARAQQNGVFIIEEKTEKRHFLYAKNTADESRSVFIKVNAIGYRRTADRPTIKIIPPNSKVLLTTLIPLKNTSSSYTYIFTANKEQENLDIIRLKSKDHSTKALKSKQLTTQ